MRHIGLFAGIGGFELAARWMGWNTIAWCEWDSFCQKVLSYHFPEAKGYGDIKQTDFTQYRGQCDILTGGFPCQPYSVAGKRLGKEDERHLWPEMLRVIREVRPRWIIGENVRGLLSWNEGVVFDEVCSDLESEGYEVQAFIIPAASVNAPHRRDRIWFVAYSDSKRYSKSTTGTDNLQEWENGQEKQSKWDGIWAKVSRYRRIASYASDTGLQGREFDGSPYKEGKKQGEQPSGSTSQFHQLAPGKTSLLNPLFVEEMMGFPRNWTVSPFQNGERKA